MEKRRDVTEREREKSKHKRTEENEKMRKKYQK